VQAYIAPSLYVFFKKHYYTVVKLIRSFVYGQDCISDCQTQIANIDWLVFNVLIYSLSTVATEYQLSIDKAGIIDQADNIDGFASTVTFWRR
jgi:hypothetical protein